jgi:hypothetical protein
MKKIVFERSDQMNFAKAFLAVLFIQLVSCGTDPIAPAKGGSTNSSIIGKVTAPNAVDLVMAGVTISTIPASDTTKTDTNGDFVLNGISPGQYILQVSQGKSFSNSNYTMTTVSTYDTVTVGAGRIDTVSIVANCTITACPCLRDTFGSIVGRVTALCAADSLVAGVTVSLMTTSAPTRTVTTDVSGKYNFNSIFPNQQYVIQVSAGRFLLGGESVATGSAVDTVTLANGQVDTVNNVVSCAISAH